MPEVSGWSETDASNNQTPPDGWPEGMQPSGVNDVGRMMMGAVKRWYNTVTAGIANALPLTGGTLTGALTVPSLHATGAITADGDLGCRTLYASGDANVAGTVGGAAVHASGDVSGATLSISGAATAGSLAAGSANISGNAQVNTLNCLGNAQVGNTLTANIANVTGALTAGSLSTTGSISAASASIGGALNVTGVSTVAALFATTLSASSSINTLNYQIQGTSFAQAGSDGNGSFTTIKDNGGASAVTMYGINGTFYRCDNAHWFTNRGASFNVACLATSGANAGKTFNASGVWDVFSDASLKIEDSVAPYTAGLAAALKLSPCSFRYAPNAPFGVEGKTYYGLVAQEVEPVLPEMVGRMAIAADGEEFATVAPGHLVFVLLNAVKELEARLAQVENRGG